MSETPPLMPFEQPFRRMVEAKKELLTLVLAPELDLETITRLHREYHAGKAGYEASCASAEAHRREREAARNAIIASRRTAARSMSKDELLDAMGYDRPELVNDRRHATRRTLAELVEQYANMIPYAN